MLNMPMDVLAQFPVRKSKQQKQAFREAVQTYCRGLGYEVTVEAAGNGAHNLVIGDPKTAAYLVTAHYDTPAQMWLPNMVTPQNLVVYLLYQFLVVGILLLGAVIPGVIVGLLTHDKQIGYFVGLAFYWILFLLMMKGPANPTNANDNTSGIVTALETARTMPENQRHKVAFVLFDLEEKGLRGSSAYRKAHKAETDRQIILNLDCVGDGDEIIFYPTKKLCKDDGKLRQICKAVSRCGKKTIAVCNKGFRFYPSDQASFPYGVGIGAFHRKKGMGPYYSRIHTAKDTVLDETNVNVLRAALTSLITNP